MKNPLKKITLIFFFIIILPVIIFSIYEFTSLSKNEEVVRNIYKNQLDAILYSINQYSDDIVNSWANKIDGQNFEDPDQDYLDDIQKVLNESRSMNWIAVSDTDGKRVQYFSNDTTNANAPEKKRYMSILDEKSGTIDKLINYQEGGFRKIEPIRSEIFPNQVILFFVMDKNSNPYSFCFMSITPEVFISSTLSPKIQNVSQEKFIISAYNMDNDSLIFSSNIVESDFASFDYRDLEDNTEQNVQKPDVQRRDFWLLPGYYLGISQIGTSLDQLVKQRSYTNLGLVLFIILILVLGIAFLYRNIKREIQLSQAKSEFVSNVSHEIRTPLSLIHMFAETLEMGRVKSEEKKNEYYDIIRKESERLSRIVNRILNFSQMEANKRKYEFTDLDVDELTKEVMDSYEFHLQNKGFLLETNYLNEKKHITGDKEAVAEAIINLIDNAMKYSAEKKHLIISLTADDKSVSVKVKDHGIGIDKSYHNDVFEQFFRVPTGNVHNAKGSGLGLSLVKHIMDAHDGQIKLDSAAGRGSTFTLIFPLKNTTK